MTRYIPPESKLTPGPVSKVKVALYIFSLSFMFKSRHATASTIGPIVTKNIGMSSVVKPPPYCQISLFSYVHCTARILDTNLHKKYYKEPP